MKIRRYYINLIIYKLLNYYDYEMDCFFCGIVEGKIESLKVFESEHFVGVLDINPASEGHILLIPKRHVNEFTDLNDVEMMELFDAIDFIFEKLKQSLNAQGLQVYAANGKNAMQRSEHFILHLIPTYEHNVLIYEYKNDFDKNELNELATKLKAAFMKK